MSKNILFISPPAGGKSTICKRLVENDGYIHISTGEMLRNVDDERVKEILEQGALVDDETVIKLLKNTLKKLDGKPFILDGFPRTLEQGIELESILKEFNLSLDLVIDLEVSHETLIKRITGRQICPKCNKTFNKYFMPPRVSGICDECGEILTTRTDDNEETFKIRFDTFMTETYPLVDYYRAKGLVVKIDGEDNNIYDRIVSVIYND